LNSYKKTHSQRNSVRKTVRKFRKSLIYNVYCGERGRWTWYSNLFKFNVLYLIFCLWGTDKSALQNGTLVLGLLPIVSTILGFKDTIYFAISNYAGLQSFNVSARCKLIYI